MRPSLGDGPLILYSAVEICDWWRWQSGVGRTYLSGTRRVVAFWRERRGQTRESRRFYGSVSTDADPCLKLMQRSQQPGQQHPAEKRWPATRSARILEQVGELPKRVEDQVVCAAERRPKLL